MPLRVPRLPDEHIHVTSFFEGCWTYFKSFLTVAKLDFRFLEWHPFQITLDRMNDAEMRWTRRNRTVTRIRLRRESIRRHWRQKLAKRRSTLLKKFLSIIENDKQIYLKIWLFRKRLKMVSAQIRVRKPSTHQLYCLMFGMIFFVTAREIGSLVNGNAEKVCGYPENGL